jgi:hypothetical protein
MSLVANAVVPAFPPAWQAPIDISAMIRDGQLTQTAALPPATQVMRPEEPSSFTLMLVGFGTLVVFRGMRKRVAKKVAVGRASKAPAKSRRRAA